MVTVCFYDLAILTRTVVFGQDSAHTPNLDSARFVGHQTSALGSTWGGTLLRGMTAVAQKIAIFKVEHKNKPSGVAPGGPKSITRDWWLAGIVQSRVRWPVLVEAHTRATGMCMQNAEFKSRTQWSGCQFGAE